jgi:hypothetical protein
MHRAIFVLEFAAPNDLDQPQNQRKNGISKSTACVGKQIRAQYASLPALQVRHLREEERYRSKSEKTNSNIIHRKAN